MPAIDIAYLRTKFDDSSFSISRDIIEPLKFRIVTCPWSYAPFRGDLPSVN